MQIWHTTVSRFIRAHTHAHSYTCFSTGTRHVCARVHRFVLYFGCAGAADSAACQTVGEWKHSEEVDLEKGFFFLICDHYNMV